MQQLEQKIGNNAVNDQIVLFHVGINNFVKIYPFRVFVIAQQQTQASETIQTLLRRLFL